MNTGAACCKQANATITGDDHTVEWHGRLLMCIYITFMLS